MPKTLKILFVTRKFPPAIGGMERFAADLHNSLMTKADVKLLKWGGRQVFLPIVIPYFLVRSVWILIFKRIDIIHMQDGALSILGVMLKFIFRKPLTVVIHGLDVTFENAIYQYVIPRALKRADHIFCISNAARDEVIKRGIDARKVIYLPLGITDDLFTHDKTMARRRLLRNLDVKGESKVLLSVGRLVRRKGVGWFIAKVLPGLVSEHPDVLLVISGDGKDRSRVEEIIRKSKMQRYVRLLGRTKDKLLKDLYNGADVFVMPNVRVRGDMEGFGRVLLEASLCELPIVATGIEGIKDAIIDGRNGFLTPEKDKSKQIKLIKNFLDDEKYSRKFGQQSRRFTIKNYGWAGIADMYIKQYQRLVE